MIRPRDFEKSSKLTKEGDRQRLLFGRFAEEDQRGERLAMDLVDLEERHDLGCYRLRLVRAPGGKIGLGKMKVDQRSVKTILGVQKNVAHRVKKAYRALQFFLIERDLAANPRCSGSGEGALRAGGASTRPDR